MNNKPRPLTNNMVEHLRLARQKDLCPQELFKGTLSGLYRRGLVSTRKVTVNGKEILAVFITSSGIDVLDEYDNCPERASR